MGSRPATSQQHAVALGAASNVSSVPQQVPYTLGAPPNVSLSSRNRVDLPALVVGGAFDPELGLLGVAAGLVALRECGEPCGAESGLRRVHGVRVLDLDA